MRAAPDALRDAYGVQVWEPLTLVTFYAPDGTPLSTVPITEGEYREDADRWPRAEASFTVPVALDARTTAPPVSPYGGRVTIATGARLPGVGDLLFPLASLDVDETTIVRPDNVIRVHAVSHEARVNEDRHTTPGETTAAGASSAVVTDLVRRTLGASWPVLDLLTSDPVLEAGAYDLHGADVWQVVEQIMDAAGSEALFAPDGSLVLRPVQSKAATPAQTFRTGESGAGTITGYESTRGWAANVQSLVWSSDEARPGALRYKWEATRTATPAAGYVSVNTADPRQATALYLHRRTTADTDVAEAFAGIAAGDRITVVQVIPDGPDKRLRYVATGPATIGASVVTVPVDLASSTGTESADNAAVEVSVRVAEHWRRGTWSDTTGGPSDARGPYGRHTDVTRYTVDRGTLPTQTQATAAALAMARRQAGAFRTVTLRTVPAPWVEPGDTVRVEFLGASAETLQVSAVTLDLSGLEPMTLTATDYAYTATI